MGGAQCDRARGNAGTVQKIGDDNDDDKNDDNDDNNDDDDDDDDHPQATRRPM